LAKDVEPIRTPRVENQFAGLQPASGGRDKKLPQRLNAQHPLGHERFLATLHTHGEDLEFSIRSSRFRSLRPVTDPGARVEGGGVERWTDGPFGEGVMRFFPEAISF